MNLNFVPVESSNLAAVAFDNGRMAVRFHRAAFIYVYDNVPEEVYTGIVEAVSPGSMYNQFKATTKSFEKIPVE